MFKNIFKYVVFPLCSLIYHLQNIIEFFTKYSLIEVGKKYQLLFKKNFLYHSFLCGEVYFRWYKRECNFHMPEPTFTNVDLMKRAIKLYIRNK